MKYMFYCNCISCTRIMYMLCDVVNNVIVMLIMLLHIVELVEVKFDYDAEQSDELRLHVGNIIKKL